MNEWNVFKNRGLHFIHAYIISLLPKIEEVRFIAKSTNAAVIGICESKLDVSVLKQEISIDNYKILRCDRNRQGGWVAGYIRNYLSYNIISVFPCEIENIFFKILLPNSKPVTVETIYRPPSQNNFLELLNSNSPGIYLLKVNNRNFRTRCEICSELTIKIPEASFWYLYC